MKGVHANLLQRVVTRLCPLVEERLRNTSNEEASARDIVYELVCCTLSSRVPFDLARAVTDRIDQWLLFDIQEWSTSSSSFFYTRLLEALTAPVHLNGKDRRYRFPYVRARQLETTRQTLRDLEGGLNALIDRTVEPMEARRKLVHVVSGFGPKQASMFLRNIGRSFDLAILDSHVMRFGLVTGILGGNPPASLSQYERLEDSFRSYTRSLGFSVGCVDSAIWITMQAARARA